MTEKNVNVNIENNSNEIQKSNQLKKNKFKGNDFNDKKDHRSEIEKRNLIIAKAKAKNIDII